MASIQRFARGDRVVHPKRPEWGTGIVRQLKATASGPNGRAQKLTIDFPNRGRVVIDTSVVSLQPGHTGPPRPGSAATSPPPAQAPRPAPSPKDSPTVSSTSTSAGWLNDLEGSTSKNELWDLPDELTNPFASISERLQATLETYKYSTEPRSLFDWAVRQTGLNDPLSKYNRHELEQAFPRFARDRDAHLRDMVRQIKRADGYAILKEAGKGLFPAGRSALDRAIRA